MKNRSNNSSIPLLSKVAKATMLALPVALLTVNTANAADFPIFEAGEKYLNHVNYTAEPGKNLIVNPTFDVCSDNISSDIYVMTSESTDLLFGDCTRHRYWGWTGMTKQAGGTYLPTTADIYSYPVEADNLSGNLSNKNTFFLNRKIEVTDANEIYVSFEYRLKKIHVLPDVFQVRLDSSKISPHEYDLVIKDKTGFQENFFVIELPESYTGTVDLYWDSNPSAGVDRIDHIFLSTDSTINPPVEEPPTDADNDGVDDSDDAFPDDIAASVDADGDGIPDSWNDGKSAADSTTGLTYLDAFPNDIAASIDTDGDGFPDSWNTDKTVEDSTTGLYLDAFINDAAASVDTDEDGQPDDWHEGYDENSSTTGLILDLDDDNDTFTDAEEIAAGTDPLNGNIHPADTDGDGWINANNRGWAVNDEYPNDAKLHQPLINILTNYGGDAENVNVVALGASSTNTEWEIASTAAPGNIINDVVETTGRDGNPTKAFRLGTTTVEDGKLVHLQSPKITTVDQNANILRIAGWVKVTGPEVFWARNHSFRMLMVNEGGTANKAKTFTLKVDNASLAFYNQDPDGNDPLHGWRYFEQTFAITGIDSTQVKLWLRSDEGPTEAFFDDLEINLVNDVDSDGDLIFNNIDNDDDNDGIVDGLDDTPLGADTLDSDGDGILDTYDNDIDNDGIANVLDNSLDLDATPPVISLIGSSSLVVTEGDDYVEQGATADDDRDGDITSDIVVTGTVDTSTVGDYTIYYNVSDALGNAAMEVMRTISVGGLDSDGDGVPDDEDAFPNDPNETLDSDGDLVGDNADVFPNDATETADSDGDGVGDNADVFPNDATETVDTDGDGVGDNGDVFPNDATETADSDGDGVGDNADLFPNDALETVDSDGDGVGDFSDGAPFDSDLTIISISRLSNGDFELGDAGWTANDDLQYLTNALSFNGSNAFEGTSTTVNGDFTSTYTSAVGLKELTLSFKAKLVMLEGTELTTSIPPRVSIALKQPDGSHIGFTVLLDTATENWSNFSLTRTLIGHDKLDLLDDGDGDPSNDLYNNDVAIKIFIPAELEGKYTLSIDDIVLYSGTDKGYMLSGIPDTDGDWVFDDLDAFPNDATETVDTDGDGVGDNGDVFPNDATETLDSDLDGVGDNGDVFPNDATETVDTDGDGVGDNGDVFPNDPNETVDTDGDGVGDNGDAFPNDATETLDSDLDGVGDNGDVFPNDATETVDTDGDGVGDNGDVFPNDATETLDSDLDGVGDNGDVFPNDATETVDTDGDGVGDNGDVFPNDATETLDSDEDGVGDNADVFPNDATETVDTDGDGTGDNSDPDRDGDGVLNENDAEPLVAITRENDLDRDGIDDQSVDEDGVDILDAIETIEAAGVISLDATGIDTDITATVSAFVSQVLADTGVEFSSIDGDAFRRSGSHNLTVELINSVGSLSSFDAVLNIIPNVVIPHTVSVREDKDIAINLTLSGKALSYPVTLSYSFEMIADDSDADAIEAGVLSIEEGQAHTLTLPGQMDGDYQVVFFEGADRNAAIVGNAVTVIYAEANIAPAFDVALMNDGEVVTLLDQTATNAEIAITITDVDMLTVHNVVVTLNGEEVHNVTNDATNPIEIVALDVATLGAGEHELMVVVTELATDDLFSTSETIALSIAGELPVLEDTVEVTLEDGTVEVVIVDTDGDGISDAEEGYGDSDGDGIADYLDDTDVANEQNITVVVVTMVDDVEVVTVEETKITVDEGLTIVIGDTLKALESGSSDDIGAEVNAENYVEVLQVADDDQAAVEASLVDVKAFLIPMIDFKIKGADAGATVNMIMQLPTALPTKSAYRKVADDGSLVEFDTSNGDSIMSAMSDEQGDCPAADSDVWQAGLVQGNDCVKVAIVDGGPNDADSTVNGVIVDPAVIVAVNSAPVVSIAGQASVNEETPVSYVATVTDADDGDILTYSWTQIQGATASLADVDTATLIATPTAADGEDLVFMLTVSDGRTMTTETITVSVNDIGPTVSASVSASAVNGGDEVTLTANVSDHDAANIAYRWVQTSGDAVTLTGENSAEATFIAPNSDTTLTFELMVSDFDNLPKTRIVSVDVSAVAEEEKDSGGSFGASVLLFLAGFVGLRRKVKGAKLK